VLAMLRSDLPPIVQEILDRALQKDAVQRYRRAGEFAQELRSCMQGLAA
jgi:eukaryotic-like serine/threonine-protein kinase